MQHDPLCYVAQNDGNCCPWMDSCDCQCMCDWIAEIRLDTLNKAREAVAAVDPYWRVETDEGEEFVMPVATALAAIDALREQ